MDDHSQRTGHGDSSLTLIDLGPAKPKLVDLGPAPQSTLVDLGPAGDLPAQVQGMPQADQQRYLAKKAELDAAQPGQLETYGQQAARQAIGTPGQGRAMADMSVGAMQANMDLLSLYHRAKGDSEQADTYARARQATEQAAEQRSGEMGRGKVMRQVARSVRGATATGIPAVAVGLPTAGYGGIAYAAISEANEQFHDRY